MPGSDRLFIMSSTFTYLAHGEPGPSLLINDAVSAMRWYFTHEQEDNFAVSARSSDDGGRTWQPVPIRELLAQAEADLVASARTGEAALLWDALAAEAALWLDRRIRFIPGDATRRRRPQTPDRDTWQFGGQAWALAMGTVPHDDLLTHLAARHIPPPNEQELDALREGAAQAVTALAMAEAPDSAELPDLLKAAALLDRLSARVEIGQLRDRLDEAQRQLLTHLDQHIRFIPGDGIDRRRPQTPDRETGQFGGPDQQDGARAVPAEAAAIPGPAPAEPASSTSMPRAMRGFPRLFGDMEAAAAWRALCPVARRDAERAMDELVRSEARVLHAKATARAWADSNPAPVEAQAVDALSRLRQMRERRRAQGLDADAQGSREYARGRLEDLDARHAVLWHAVVLVDAQQAARYARHEAAVAIAQATLSPAHQQPPTMEGGLAEHDAFDAFDAQVQAVRERIDHILAEQRQLTRDALHRLLPQTVGRRAMARLRTQQVDNSGLGRDAELKAIRALATATSEFDDLQTRFTNGTPQAGRPPVTENEVNEAQRRLHQAKRDLAELRSSRRDTLCALDALDSVADLTPTPPTGMAARAATIAAQSRERARPRTPAAGSPHHDERTAEQHRLPHRQAPHRGTTRGPS